MNAKKTEQVVNRISYIIYALAAIFAGIVLLSLGVDNWLKLNGPLANLNTEGSKAITKNGAIEGEIDWCIGPYYSKTHYNRIGTTYTYDYLISTKDGRFITLQVKDKVNDSFEKLANRRIDDLYSMMFDENFDMEKEMSYHNDEEAFGTHFTGVINPFPTDERGAKLTKYIDKINNDAGKTVIDKSKIMTNCIISFQTKTNNVYLILLALVSFLLSGFFIYLAYSK